VTEPEAKPRKHPPPWLFVFGGTAYGVTGAFAAQIMPYASEHAGIDVGKIGWFGTLMLVPSWFQFMLAPIVDVGLQRKHWQVLTAALSALCLLIAFAMPIKEHLTLYLGFAVTSAVMAALISACNGALIAVTMPDEHRGAASAWYNVGNLSGGGISGALGIYMLGHDVAPIWVGVTVAAITVLPSLAMLLVIEPPGDHLKKFSGMFAATVHEVGEAMSHRAAITGMLMCFFPVGTCALVNYFSGMTKDFHASADVVAAVSGGGSVVLTAIGALAGGYLADRYNRRILYLSSGVVTAICALAMTVAPRTELTYAVGVGFYNLITGVSYAVFTAFVLETIGDGGKSAATRYTLYNSAANFAIAWVGLVDTRFHEEHGVGGVLVSDALLNIVGAIVLGLVFWKFRSFGRRRGQPALPELPKATARDA
jgi:MFS transporter, PAT family, beta-lactamase induction signal transducer AmpG